ncbi:hypothetical protein Fmac_001859 [Flemingia macrophylla]|uniref:Uncharacterized protein n=1 Tax=Flemingia macrophylla TaxID=520843 RepID=A0ABD1NIA1_9FABA
MEIKLQAEYQNENLTTRKFQPPKSKCFKLPLSRLSCVGNWKRKKIGHGEELSNTLLSADASPAMLHAAEELSNFTPHAAVLCDNVSMFCPS